MKTFRVTVNGAVYDVAVEETNGVTQPMAAPAPQAAAQLQAPAAAQPKPAAPAAPAPAAPVASGAVQISAPMPGAILDIKVSQNDKVTKNQVIAILEAMKMENEIVAPQDGVVVGIHTSKGATVSTGDLLVSLS